MLASFLIAGFWFAYWRVADMDLWVVYNAFLLNTPLPQEYFDHPGYLSILLLSYWLRALHAVGLIHVASLSGIPPVSDTAGFADVWMRATQAGRVLSFMFMIAYVVTFACLVKAIVGDRRIAGLAGFFLACAGGLTMQMRIMRTELLATGFFMIALLILIAVAKRGERAWRPAAVGFASLLITLGMLNKIQILFLICALPILVLPFGPEAKPQDGFWRLSRYAWPAVARERDYCGGCGLSSEGHHHRRDGRQDRYFTADRLSDLSAGVGGLDRRRHGRLRADLANAGGGDARRHVRGDWPAA